MKVNRGYTLIEILVVMVIMGLMLVFAISSFSQFTQRQVLKVAQERIIDDLHYTQSLAAAGKKPANCTKLNGWTFAIVPNSNIYTIAADCRDDLGNIEACVDLDCSEQIELDPGVRLQMVSGGINSPVTYLTLSRGIDPANSKDIRIRHSDFPGTTHIITIDASGTVVK